MNASPHGQGQQYAYRRNPARTIHASTFQPGQFGHSHGYTVIPSQSPAQSTFTHIPSASPPIQAAPPAPAPQQAPSSGGGGFSLASIAKYANVDELKGLVNRFGGLDGILSTVTTVQKVMSTVGQIAPLVKVFTGSLKKDDSSSEAKSAPIPARRRSTANRTRRVRRTTSSGKRKSSSTATTGPRKSTPLTKRPSSNR